jgi:hypothetical protein
MFLRIETSEGDSKTVPLKGPSVAGFYERVFFKPEINGIAEA